MIPGQGARTPHALWPKKKQSVKQKQYCNKFNKDFRNGPHQKKVKIKKNYHLIKKQTNKHGLHFLQQNGLRIK